MWKTSEYGNCSRQRQPPGIKKKCAPRHGAKARDSLVAAEQKTQEAATGQSVSESLLLILGYAEQEICKMDPIEEEVAVAHSSIMAPLADTVIKKDAVPLEHVTPQMQLFQVADLSSKGDRFEPRNVETGAAVDGRVEPFRGPSKIVRQIGDDQDFQSNATSL